MDPNTVLTEAQREALRLVAKGFGSKDIARILGRSHHSVDRRIERAMQNLGAASRFSAARMLIEAEGGTYELLEHAEAHAPMPLAPKRRLDMHIGHPDIRMESRFERGSHAPARTIAQCRPSLGGAKYNEKTRPQSVRANLPTGVARCRGLPRAVA